MDNFVLASLAASLALNAFCAFKLFSKKPPLSIDAQQLLAELARGKALLEVKVIDAAGLFYRSPRG